LLPPIAARWTAGRASVSGLLTSGGCSDPLALTLRRVKRLEFLDQASVARDDLVRGDAREHVRLR
jgi:hypothetical protein